MRNSIKESSPSPDVVADVLLLDSFFQAPGSVDLWFIQEVRDFLHFVDRTEPGFSIADYPFVIDILYGKGIDDLTVFDLEDIGFVLEEVARHYEALEFNREKDLQKN